MAILSHADIQPFIATYGYWGVGLVVGIESMGIPLPGETVLVLAAIYAARFPDLSIVAVVLAAIVGCIIGDNIGYIIGRRFGFRLLLRHGPKLNITEDRIKVGQFLFMKFGGSIVFIGRFIALLRILAAFLAGVNRMPWPSFLFYNATGGIIWACLFGFGGYLFGELLIEEHAKWMPLVVTVAVLAFCTVAVMIHRFEKQLLIQARAALPGPLETGPSK